LLLTFATYVRFASGTEILRQTSSATSFTKGGFGHLSVFEALTLMLAFAVLMLKLIEYIDKGNSRSFFS